MTDRKTVFAIVGILGLAAIAFGVGAIYLVSVGRAVPGELWTLTGGALGALSSLLASTRSTPPAPVADPQPAPPVDPAPIPPDLGDAR